MNHTSFASSRVAAAWHEIQAARAYTVRLLEDIGPDDWFWMPPQGITHVAWQVGHLAMANYRLALERIRDHRPSDDALISPDFVATFAKGSAPTLNAGAYPPPAEIRVVFDRVYEQAARELPNLSDLECDAAPHKPHPLAATKLECLLWNARHEMLHAGQIGLLRRLMGKPSLW
ncbi:MAG: DinB family protein [Planctomycetes bacterium]|nr:DinB family protein [Planctomycetota bacterium]